MTNLTFSNCEGLFPNPEEDRALKYPLKKYIILIGRILAFDSPSNFFLKGFLDSLLEKGQSSREFLEEFVVVAIPMVNIDGASLGHTFTDGNGDLIGEKFGDPESNHSLMLVKKYLDLLQSEVMIHSIIEAVSHLTSTDPEIYGRKITAKSAL